MMKKNGLLILTLSVFLSGFAQQQELGLEEAVNQRWGAFRAKGMSSISWVPGTGKISYVDKGVVYMLDNPTAVAKQVVTYDELREAAKGREETPIYGIHWVDADHLRFQTNESTFLYSLSTKKAEQKAFTLDLEKLDFNDKFHSVAGVKGQNLVVSNAKDQVEISNYEDGDNWTGHAVHRREFGIYKGTFWAPESNRIAFYQKDESMVTDYPLVDHQALPSKLKDYKYPMAGGRSHHAQVGIYDLEKKKTVYLQTGTPAEKYLTNIQWTPDEKFILVAEINRGQDTLVMNAYDPDNGKKVRRLFVEAHDKYVEPDQPAYFVKGSAQFVWMSERSGYRHLHLYDTRGKHYRDLTPGENVVMEILGMDAKSKYLYYTATDELGSEVHGFRVSLKGGKPKRITKEPGVHHLTYNSENGQLIDYFTSKENPGKTQVISESGKVLAVLKEHANGLANKNIGKVELTKIEAEDGTPLWTRTVYPSDFSERKKYPVLVYVYNGPGVQLLQNRYKAGAAPWMFWMANQGYIIHTVDGRGSNNRGREFEQKIYRNLGQLEVQDQLHAVSLLKKEKYIDANRVAVFGWSYGGFMTINLLLSTDDVFTCGVAGGPVTNWNMYEIMYTERYMDTPGENPEGYKQANLSNRVNQLDEKLMLIHGSSDDVVVMQHSMRFLKACIDADVPVDFMVYPGHAHNVYGPNRVHLMKKVLNYILDNN